MFLSFALLWSSFIQTPPALAADPPAPKPPSQVPSQAREIFEMNECNAQSSSCQAIGRSYEVNGMMEVARRFFGIDCFKHFHLEGCLRLGLSDKDPEIAKKAEEDCATKLDLRRCVRGVGWKLKNNDRAAGLARLEDLCLRKLVVNNKRPEVCALFGASLNPEEIKPYVEQCFSTGSGCVIAAGGAKGRGAAMLLLGSACQRNWVGACVFFGELESEAMIAEARDRCSKGDDMSCAEVFGFAQSKDPKSAETTSLGTTLCGKGYGPICASMKMPTPKSSDRPKQ